MNDERKGYIKPCKLVGKKCEKEVDARDMVRLESENINNAGRKGRILVGGNLIDHPENIIDNPDKITEQILDMQASYVDDETSKCRRIYSTIYRMSSKQYGVSLEDAFEMAKLVADVYGTYPSVYAVSKHGDVIRTDMLFGNYSTFGSKMTKNFKPAMMYNAFKIINDKRHTK